MGFVVQESIVDGRTQAILCLSGVPSTLEETMVERVNNKIIKQFYDLLSLKFAVPKGQSN